MTPASTASPGAIERDQASRSDIATSIPTATVASVVRLRRKLSPVAGASRDATTNSAMNPIMTITVASTGSFALSGGSRATRR